MNTQSNMDAFEALWQQAKDSSSTPQAQVIDTLDTSMELSALLQQLSRLADELSQRDLIETSQYDQMLTAVEQVEEVVATVDADTLTQVLAAIN